MNGMIGSDVNPTNWPRILALIEAEKTISSQDKKRMHDEAHRFLDSPPMDRIAMWDELAGLVTLTMGRRSYDMSEKLRFIGFKVVPDSDYLKYTFETTKEYPIAYVRVNLKKLATENKWQLDLI